MTKMKTNRNIYNVQDLRSEIVRLKALKREQEHYLSDQLNLLQDQISAPSRFFQKIGGIFTGSSDHKSESTAFKADWLTSSLRLGLPFLFNRVLFKKAGVLKKIMLVLASQRAANFVNADRIAGLIDKLTQFIRPKSKAKPASSKEEVDYGIPPDSETY